MDLDSDRPLFQESREKFAVLSQWLESSPAVARLRCLCTMWLRHADARRLDRKSIQSDVGLNCRKRQQLATAETIDFSAELRHADSEDD